MLETALIWAFVGAAIGFFGYLFAYGFRGWRWALVAASVGFAIAFFVALWWTSQSVGYTKPGLRP